MSTCQYCPKVCKNAKGLAVHQRTCKAPTIAAVAEPEQLIIIAEPPTQANNVAQNIQPMAGYTQAELAEFVAACDVDAAATPTPIAATPAPKPPAVILSDLLGLNKDYKAKTATLQHVERFDADALNYILQNKERYAALVRPEKMEQNEFEKVDPFVLSGKYLAKSKGKNSTPDARMVAVQYNQANSHGRFFAVGQLSLQSLIREIRHTISRKYYKDIDIKNAHPVFLLHFCDKLGLSAPFLRGYVENRAAFLASIYPDNADLAKKVVLAMLNGGTRDYEQVPNKTDMLKALKAEIARIHSHIATGPAFEAHKVWKRKKKASKSAKPGMTAADLDRNAAGSYVNTLFCQFENRILQTIWKAMGCPHECALCFDGIMVPIGLPVNLAELSDTVHAEHGIRIALAEKAMDEGFDLSGEDVRPYAPPEAEDRTYYYGDYSQFVPDPEALEQKQHAEADVRKYFKDTQIYIKNGGRSYLLTKNLDFAEGIAREYVVYKNVKESDPPFANPSRVCHFDIALTDGTKKPASDFYKENCLASKYEAAQFIPYLIENPHISPKVFNTFGGYRFPYEPLPPGQAPASIARILSHKRDVICSGDAYAFEYYCRWIAQLIQQPTQMLPISIFIKSKEQGTGKSRETSQLAAMLGEAYTIEINRLENVAGKFNAIMLDKLLIIGNDVADKGGFDVSAVNSLISEKKKTIEFKGIDPRQADIYARIILTSNHDCALLFTEENRRWVALNPLSTMKGNKAYWDALSADIEDSTVQRDAFLYFANYPIDTPWIDEAGRSHAWDWQKLPKTDRNTAVKEANMNPLLSFLKSGVDGDVAELKFVPYAMCEDEKSAEPVEVNIGNGEFYDAYEKWHRVNIYKAIKKAQDVRREMEELGFPKKVVRVNYVRVNGYNLCPRRILLAWQKAMGETPRS